MKTCAIFVLLLALALPVGAAVIHDEGVNGDLSSNPAAPTAIAFPVGSSTIIGTVSGVILDRDYITFTVGAGQVMSAMNLLAHAPDNLGFCAINAGATSFIPNGASIGSFLSGIHVSTINVGSNLLNLFVTSSVTTNSLATPTLGPGSYCFLIQQTSPITQSYSIEFVIDGTVSTNNSTWGAVKALYR